MRSIVRYTMTADALYSEVSPDNDLTQVVRTQIDVPVTSMRNMEIANDDQGDTNVIAATVIATERGLLISDKDDHNKFNLFTGTMLGIPFDDIKFAKIAFGGIGQPLYIFVVEKGSLNRFALITLASASFATQSGIRFDLSVPHLGSLDTNLDGQADAIYDAAVSVKGKILLATNIGLYSNHTDFHSGTAVNGAFLTFAMINSKVMTNQFRIAINDLNDDIVYYMPDSESKPYRIAYSKTSLKFSKPKKFSTTDIILSMINGPTFFGEKNVYQSDSFLPSLNNADRHLNYRYGVHPIVRQTDYTAQWDQTFVAMNSRSMRPDFEKLQFLHHPGFGKQLNIANLPASAPNRLLDSVITDAIEIDNMLICLATLNSSGIASTPSVVFTYEYDTGRYYFEDEVVNADEGSIPKLAIAKYLGSIHNKILLINGVLYFIGYTMSTYDLTTKLWSESIISLAPMVGMVSVDFAFARGNGIIIASKTGGVASTPDATNLSLWKRASDAPLASSPVHHTWSFMGTTRSPTTTVEKVEYIPELDVLIYMGAEGSVGSYWFTTDSLKSPSLATSAIAGTQIPLALNGLTIGATNALPTYHKPIGAIFYDGSIYLFYTKFGSPDYNKFVIVRWVHKLGVAGIFLPPHTHARGIYSTNAYEGVKVVLDGDVAIVFSNEVGYTGYRPATLVFAYNMLINKGTTESVGSSSIPTMGDCIDSIMSQPTFADETAFISGVVSTGKGNVYALGSFCRIVNIRAHADSTFDRVGPTADFGGTYSLSGSPDKVPLDTDYLNMTKLCLKSIQRGFRANFTKDLDAAFGSSIVRAKIIEAPDSSVKRLLIYQRTWFDENNGELIGTLSSFDLLNGRWDFSHNKNDFIHSISSDNGLTTMPAYSPEFNALVYLYADNYSRATSYMFDERRLGYQLNPSTPGAPVGDIAKIDLQAVRFLSRGWNASWRVFDIVNQSRSIFVIDHNGWASIFDLADIASLTPSVDSSASVQFVGESCGIAHVIVGNDVYVMGPWCAQFMHFDIQNKSFNPLNILDTLLGVTQPMHKLVYSPSKNKIYTAAYSSNRAPNNIFKVFEYDIVSNTWSLLATLDSLLVGVEKPIDTIHLLEDIVVGSILIVSINGLLFGLDLNDNGAIIVDTLTRPYLFFLSSRSPVNGDPIHAIVENKYGVVDPNESYLYFISPYGSIGTFDRWTHIVHTGSHESISPPPPTPTPMKAPTGLSASLVTSTTLYLQWDRFTIEPDAYYEIWQLGNPIRIGIELYPDANPGWNVLHGLSPNTEYTFSVVSRDRNGIRPDSTSVSITVATIGVRLEPPQDIEITNATENSITLQWTTVELSRFIIIQDGVTLATVDSMPLGRSTYILTGLTPDTRYTLTVKAVDLAGIKLDSYPNTPYPRDKKTLPLP